MRRYIVAFLSYSTEQWRYLEELQVNGRNTARDSVLIALNRAPSHLVEARGLRCDGINSSS